MLATTLWIVAAAAIHPTAVTDLFVDQSATCSVGNGTMLAPFCRIREALNVAAPGDVIHIAPGVYIGRPVVTTSVTLIGDGGADVTILDGQGTDGVLEITADADVRIEGLTIANGVEGSQSSVSGGIECWGGLTMVDSVVRDCTESANLSAAGIVFVARPSSVSPELRLERCAFYGNAGTSVSVIGQLSTGTGPTVFLENCSFQKNTLYSCLFAIRASVQVTGSTFDRNQTLGTFTVVETSNCDVEISNSTISGNDGPGVFISGELGLSSSFIRNVTIVNNVTSVDPASTVSRAGGLKVFPGASGTSVEVSSSIIAGNRYMTTPSDVDGSPIVSGGHNLIGADDQANFIDGALGDIVGSTSQPKDPMVSPIGDFGGLTMTHIPLIGSPAIGTGPASQTYATDQRGLSRQGGAQDIGATRHSFGELDVGCTAVPNSTGVASDIFSTGSDVAADNQFQLHFAGLPPLSAVLGIVSMTSGMTLNPGGSDGVLCLAGSIGRVVSSTGQVAVSDSSGLAALSVDLAAVPQPTGTQATLTGTNWYFQAWHRDSSPAGATSNFTRSVLVTFR